MTSPVLPSAGAPVTSPVPCEACEIKACCIARPTGPVRPAKSRPVVCSSTIVTTKRSGKPGSPPKSHNDKLEINLRQALRIQPRRRAPGFLIFDFLTDRGVPLFAFSFSAPSLGSHGKGKTAKEVRFDITQYTGGVRGGGHGKTQKEVRYDITQYTGGRTVHQSDINIE